MLPVFNNTDKFKYIWDINMIAVIILLIYFIPISFIYRLKFRDLISSEIYKILPFIFITDLLVNLNTNYYEKGKQVNDRSKIVVNYLKNYWF
jgi:hypothetical protein